METLVYALQEFKYDGIMRYRNELFSMRGHVNDDLLVKHGFVRVVTGDYRDDVLAAAVTDDYSGRSFLDHMAREAYRIKEVNKPVLIERRPPGRPKGSKNTVPQREPGAADVIAS